MCVDGRCCDGACTDVCKACNVPGLEGTCSNVVAGSQPSHGSCNAEAPSTCGRDGTCDGAGVCRKHVQGTICVAASCNTSTDIFTPAKKCDGAGTCVNETAVSPTPLRTSVGVFVHRHEYVLVPQVAVHVPAKQSD